MKKLLLVVSLLMAGACVAVADNFTLTTYYPVPNGRYMDLSVSNNIGIGTTEPQTALELSGDGAILSRGTFGAGWVEPNLGAGTRFLWYPGKAAIRAGRVVDAKWDNANIGNYSHAFGYMTTASGIAAAAFNQQTTASGNWSTAFGVSTAATAQISTAFGVQTQANGAYSTAFGDNSIAGGITSTAFGRNTTASGMFTTAYGYYSTAQAYASTALGRYNVFSGDTANWVATDPLFSIGIGANAGAPADALTVLKNGNVGIGTADPVTTLDIAGSLYTDGGSGDINGSGDVAVTDSVLLGNYLVNLTNLTRSQLARADVDGNGVVNHADWNTLFCMAAALGKEDCKVASYNIFWGVGSGGLANRKFASRKFVVDGEAAIGAGYTAKTPPTSGALIEGTVGIGTTAPSQKLTVDSGGWPNNIVARFRNTAANTAAIEIENATSSNPKIWGIAAHGDAVPVGMFTIREDGGAGTARFMIVPGGNVGIGIAAGSAPTQKLDVNGTGVFAGNVIIGTAGNQSTFSRGIVDGAALGGLNLDTPFGVGANNIYAGDFQNYSDERLKQDITPVTHALDKVKAMNGVYFKFKKDPSRVHLGLIAQNVEKAVPEVVSSEGDGMKSVSYGNLVAVLIEAVKEQQVMIDELRARIDAMKPANP